MQYFVNTSKHSLMLNKKHKDSDDDLVIVATCNDCKKEMKAETSRWVDRTKSLEEWENLMVNLIVKRFDIENPECK